MHQKPGSKFLNHIVHPGASSCFNGCSSSIKNGRLKVWGSELCGKKGKVSCPM
eukprot:Gb_03557 [translate_table: standard]